MNAQAPIIYIQDKRSDAIILEELLKLSDYKQHQLIHYASFQRAISELRHEDFEVGIIFIDPFLKDVEAIQALKKLIDLPAARKAMVIVLTSAEDYEFINVALEAGAQDFLTKENLSIASLNRSIRYGISRLSVTRELKATNAAKDKLISVLAHDLRTPLTGISELSKMIVEEIDSTSKEEIKETFTLIQKSADSAYGLMQNLLEWSRLQVGTVKAKPKDISLATAVDESLVHFENSLRKKNLTIEKNIDPSLMLKADENMLQSILRNLLSNAVKFCHRGKKIFLEAGKDEEAMVWLKVRDQGIGMPPKMAHELLDGMSSSGRPGTEGESSSGFGLLLVTSFIKENKGYINLESEEGQGTTFTIGFPQASEVLVHS